MIEDFSLQLLRIGFDEETSQMDTKNLFQQIEKLRNPSKITLGLKPDLTSCGPGPEASLSLASPHGTDKSGGIIPGHTIAPDELLKNKNSVRRKNIGTYRNFNILS